MRTNMRKSLASAAAAVAVLAGATLGAPVAHAATFDVVQDFGNSVFSYTYGGGTGLTAGIYAPPYAPGSPPPVTAGYTNQGAVPNFAYIYQNISGSTIVSGTVTDPNNTLWMDPEAYADVTVTFTAPVTALYTVAGAFSGIDTTGNTHGVVALGNSSIYSGTISAGGLDPFGGSVSLTAGQTIMFQVLSPGTQNTCGLTPNDICFLSTGLTATIAYDDTSSIGAAPLPPAWTLLLGGFAGLGLVARRGRKRHAFVAA